MISLHAQKLALNKSMRASDDEQGINKLWPKEREKTLMRQSIRKEKLRKVGCFLKSFNMIIHHFFSFASPFATQFLLFDIRMTQEISKGKVGNSKQQIFFTDKMCINDAKLKLIIREVCSSS